MSDLLEEIGRALTEIVTLRAENKRLQDVVDAAWPFAAGDHVSLKDCKGSGDPLLKEKIILRDALRSRGGEP